MLVLTRRETRRGSDKLYFALLSDFAASGAIAPVHGPSPRRVDVERLEYPSRFIFKDFLFGNLERDV